MMASSSAGMKMKLVCFVLLLSLSMSLVSARSWNHVLKEDEAVNASKLEVYPKPQFPGHLHRNMFPKGFIFGSAGSAYQVFQLLA